MIRISIRLSEEEYKQLKDASGRAHVPMSQFSLLAIRGAFERYGRVRCGKSATFWNVDGGSRAYWGAPYYCSDCERAVFDRGCAMRGMNARPGYTCDQYVDEVHAKEE